MSLFSIQEKTTCKKIERSKGGVSPYTNCNSAYIKRTIQSIVSNLFVRAFVKTRYNIINEVYLGSQRNKLEIIPIRAIVKKLNIQLKQ